MAHTTSVYYRDRLGFEPEGEPSRQCATSSAREKGGAGDGPEDVDKRRNVKKSDWRSDNGERVVVSNMPSGGVYEENLTKFKGRTAKCDRRGRANSRGISRARCPFKSGRAEVK